MIKRGVPALPRGGLHLEIGPGGWKLRVWARRTARSSWRARSPSHCQTQCSAFSSITDTRSWRTSAERCGCTTSESFQMIGSSLSCHRTTSHVAASSSGTSKPVLSHPSSRERATMKVNPSVKAICDKCKVISRHGVVMVICENTRHKQRQG